MGRKLELELIIFRKKVIINSSDYNLLLMFLLTFRQQKQ